MRQPHVKFTDWMSRGVRTMSRSAKLALLLCLALAAAAVRHPAFAATLDEQISARLDALEKENAALRARVNRLEASKAARMQHGAAPRRSPAPMQNAEALAADAEYGVPDKRRPSRRHRTVEPAASLRDQRVAVVFAAGRRRSRIWDADHPFADNDAQLGNQSLKPNFSPTFRVGARYMPSESDDIELNWTHLNNTANGSFSAGPTQMVGPPYLIGPESALYQIGQRRGAIGL